MDITSYLNSLEDCREALIRFPPGPAPSSGARMEGILYHCQTHCRAERPRDPCKIWKKRSFTGIISGVILPRRSWTYAWSVP